MPKPRNLFVALLALAFPLSVLAGVDPPSEQFAAQMRQNLTAKDPQAQLRLIRGLRALKDPALAPLFTQMGLSKNSALRAESTLALAELEPSRGIDLLVVRKLEPAQQAYVLSEALDTSLVKTEQLEDLARWTDLQPALYVSVASRLVAAQKRVDPARLKQILKGDDVLVAALAGVVLQQLAQPDGAPAAFDKLIAAHDRPGGSEAIRRVLSIIRERKLSAGVDFAKRAMAAHGSDRLLRFEAVVTLITVDPSGERAAGLIASELAACVDAAEKVRLAVASAFAALDRDAGLPARAIDVFKRDPEPIVALVGESLEALAAKSAAAGPMNKLVARRCIPAIQWILKAAPRLAPEDAREVRLAILKGALSNNERQYEELASSAASALAKTDPELLRAPLLAAIEAKDDRTIMGILVGALRSENPKSAFLADVGRATMDTGREAPPWPNPPTEATAVILRARFIDKPSRALIEELAKVATGSGRLPDSGRAQAAWMALKGSTDDRAALARIISDIAP